MIDSGYTFTLLDKHESLVTNIAKLEDNHGDEITKESLSKDVDNFLQVNNGAFKQVSDFLDLE